MCDLSGRIALIRERVAAAASRSGRSPAAIQLMAVTKTQPYAAVAAALAGGITLIGENRVQEAMEKIPVPDERSGQLHLIGHLQKNKARKAARFFDAIQSLDDPETLLLLEQECQLGGRTLDILIEVNTSGEAAKQGIRDPDSARRLLETLLAQPHLRPRGLMTIGPLGNDDRANRRAFASLRQLHETLNQEFTIPGWDTLSMGMSQDYEAAIEEGATLIRLGTILFGSRS